jgi:hypothetical protein
MVTWGLFVIKGDVETSLENCETEMLRNSPRDAEKCKVRRDGFQ